MYICSVHWKNGEVKCLFNKNLKTFRYEKCITYGPFDDGIVIGRTKHKTHL